MKKRPVLPHPTLVDVAVVQLAKGKGIALVDARDAELAGRFNWCRRAHGTAKTAYAQSSVTKAGKKTVTTLHQEIGRAMGLVGDVDHRNHDGLDCRRHNLRDADSSTNHANTKRRADNTSGFKGVCWSKRYEKWQADITVRGSRVYLGLFDDPAVAGRVYDRAAIRFFGEFAHLNFPQQEYESGTPNV